MAHNGNGRHFDPGIRAILAELRDLRLETRADRRRSDARFELLMRELRKERVAFREASARRETVTLKAFKDIRAVGLSIVKTVNRHTRILEHQSLILERMDRKLGVRGNGGSGNGRRA